MLNYLVVDVTNKSALASSRYFIFNKSECLECLSHFNFIGRLSPPRKNRLLPHVPGTYTSKNSQSPNSNQWPG
jgi:hypothetical protein